MKTLIGRTGKWLAQCAMGALLFTSLPCAALQGATVVKGPDDPKPILPDRVRPVFIDRTIFMPDHWWAYDGSDLYPKAKARFSEYVLAQSGVVSIGRKSAVNSGARVLYGVTEFADEDAALRALNALRPRKPGSNERQVSRPVAYGNGGHDATTTLLGPGKAAVSLDRRVYIRWGRWIVTVLGNSNMRAFVGKPPRGERPWLHEAVMEKVLSEVTRRWTQIQRLEPEKP